jgi:hypothetical protein
LTNSGLAIHVEQIDFRKLVMVEHNSKLYQQIKLTLDWGLWADSTWKAMEIRLYRALTQFPHHFDPSLRWTRLENDKLELCNSQAGQMFSEDWSKATQRVTAPLVVLLSIQFHVLWI